MASIIIQMADVTKFYYALGHARRVHKHGEALTKADDFVSALAQRFLKFKERYPNTPHKDIQEMFYKHYAKLFLVKDGQRLTGMFAVIDGEIQALVSLGVSGSWLVQKAIQEGGKTLDCFDGFLPDFYKRHGFTEYKREPNWTEGQPDVVYMVLKP